MKNATLKLFVLFYFTEPAVWGQWTSFGDCSVTCGVGKRVRDRTCEPSLECPDCTGDDCLCDGEHAQWDFETCSNSYGKFIFISARLAQ